jgi:hypothetical protein
LGWIILAVDRKSQEVTFALQLSGLHQCDWKAQQVCEALARIYNTPPT